MAHAILRGLAALALAVLCLAAGPAAAQCDGECPPEPETPVFDPPYIPEVFNDPVFTPNLSTPVVALVGATATPDATARVVARVEESFEFCTALVQREYVVDCLSERIDAIAQGLPDTGEYAEMKSALDQAAKRLAAIVARYPSPTLPAGVATTQGAAPQATSRPIRPVATEAADAAIAEAAQVIEETQTILLRSAGGSTDRAAAYTAVSGALETGTVLLRSA